MRPYWGMIETSVLGQQGAGPERYLAFCDRVKCQTFEHWRC
jgi:hypothetical protein